MFTLPIISFFIAQHIFREKESADSWAGAAAILMTNVIVASYCYSAYVEDRDLKEEDNDARGPRVGAFKQRTD